MVNASTKRPAIDRYSINGKPARVPGRGISTKDKRVDCERQGNEPDRYLHPETKPSKARKCRRKTVIWRRSEGFLKCAKHVGISSYASVPAMLSNSADEVSLAFGAIVARCRIAASLLATIGRLKLSEPDRKANSQVFASMGDTRRSPYFCLLPLL